MSTIEKTRKGRNGGMLLNTKKGDPSPNPEGRKPKLVTHINQELKEQGYEVVTKAHIVDAYLTLINLPMSKIAAIASSKNVFYKEGERITFLSEGDEYPILYRLVAKELINDKRGAEYLEKILDRAIGKSTQVNDVTIKGGITVIMEDAKNCEPIPGTENTGL